jgi:tRNA pseudouridine38-40 synthase
LRYFIQLAYRGTRYHGWQVQHNAPSVQAELNRALETLLRHPAETVGSGRTDTGVHAEEQFVHLDTEVALSNASHLHRLNILLPPDIAIRNIFPVPEWAHARFDAHTRSYQYRISSRKDPFGEKLSYFFHRSPDADEMNRAASLLLRHTDFQSFSKVHTDVNHFHCEVKEARWRSEGELLVFDVTANRFLRGMVRTLVGTLLEVGEGRLSVAGFEEIILNRDRKKAGRAVPPEGLFLTRILYPSSVAYWQEE